MSDPRLLIAGTSYCFDEHSRELCSLWHRVVRHLNPGEDIVLVDSCSPFDPNVFLPKGTNIFRFDENVGTINRGGKDGSGRGITKAIELAIRGQYDYVVISEADVIFTKSFRDIINKMHRTGVKVASPGLANPYTFLEWSNIFLNVEYAMESKFIERFDWENAKPWPLEEIRLEQLFKDDLFLLPLRGLRNDHNQLNVENFPNHWPYGLPDWLHHVQDINVIARWLTLLNIVPEK